MKDTPITLRPIGPANIEAICLLAGECFIDDPFYLSIHPDRNVRIKELQSLFARSIQICMQYGHACCYEENGQPVAFALWFDYGLLKKADSTAFNHIFPTQAGTPLQRKIHNEHLILHVSLDFSSPVHLGQSVTKEPGDLASQLLSSNYFPGVLKSSDLISAAFSL